MSFGRNNNRQLLFREQDLRYYIDPCKQKMIDEIAFYDKDALLNTSTYDLARYFVEKYSILFVELNNEEISAREEEVKIDVSHNPGYVTFDDRPTFVDGINITISVPFIGQSRILYCNPNQAYMASPIEGVVEGDEIIFSMSKLPQNKDDFKSAIDRHIAAITERLEMMRSDVAQYNASLFTIAQQLIDARKEKLKENSSLVASLGFKTRRREGASRTYAVPDVKRIIKPPTPTQLKVAEELDPALPPVEFEHIIEVVHNMVAVMEQSPKSFVNMDEEAIRTQILVQLNGQYEGQATGETFNGEGKTDIIIKSGRENIFIAECKFWGGEKVFAAALNQLLGYATWRDGKIALIVFNRNKNTSVVLRQILPLVKANSNFVSFDGNKGDTDFRFTLSHPSDSQKHLSLAVLVFDIPQVGVFNE